MRAALVALAVVCAASEAQAQAATADAASAVSVAQPAAADGVVVASDGAATDQPLPAGQTQTALTEPAPVQDNGGTVAELQKLIQNNAVTELRTTYNGSYGASLLFDGNEMQYYVTLFQQKNFWRVIKTSSDVRADGIYADFVRRTTQLSDIEIRRTKLEAQKAYTAKLIAINEERAAYLQADLDNQHAQQALVTAHQQETAQQAAQLEAARKAEQSKLDALRRQIEQMRQQTESGLPRRYR
ncbi:DUF2968 domain-containing protein [Pararobbsia silviterrae]|uniref:DUF2968 domain-containing protein n=2 Tax=Pararobbsia silviterrae TaxID=1792498 RepID=A0A494XIA6_9BURK|nr:DUF2968 domain-containing protein [Pararobbsia silviterrae]